MYRKDLINMGIYKDNSMLFKLSSSSITLKKVFYKPIVNDIETAQVFRNINCLNKLTEVKQLSTVGEYQISSLSYKDEFIEIQDTLKMYKYLSLDTESTGISILLADIEHMSGYSVVAQFKLLRDVEFDPIESMLKVFFTERFNFIANTVRLDVNTSFDVLILSFKSRDLDLFMDYAKSSFDIVHFPATRNLFNVFTKMILFIWDYLCIWFGGVGMYMYISGKLSRHLLTKSQKAYVRIGKTSQGIVTNNLLFKYRQTNSETGAYGLNLFYYTKSKIIKEPRKIS